MTHVENPEYAGNPLEPLIPKCNNSKDWAISRDSRNGSPQRLPMGNRDNINVDGIVYSPTKSLALLTQRNIGKPRVLRYAKTLYKPTRPDDMNEEINSYTNQRLPHFFKYAKDKRDGQIVDVNDSFVNKLERMIPNPRINFRKLNIGPIDYTLMMHDPDIDVECSVTSNGRLIEEETNPVIVEYCKFDKQHYMSVDSAINLSNTNKSESYMRMQTKNSKMASEVRAALSRFGYDDDEIVDILVKYLYGIRKSANKTMLWLAYGDVIYGNLSGKLKAQTKEVQCVDCGEWFEVGIFDSATCRCEDCASRHKRELSRLRKQRQRNREQCHATPQ